MKRTWAAGLDMGGTNIRCAAVSAAGEVLLMERGPSHASRHASDVSKNIAAQLLHLLDSARDRELGSPRAMRLWTARMTRRVWVGVGTARIARESDGTRAGCAVAGGNRRCGRGLLGARLVGRGSPR